MFVAAHCLYDPFIVFILLNFVFFSACHCQCVSLNLVFVIHFISFLV